LYPAGDASGGSYIEEPAVPEADAPTTTTRPTTTTSSTTPESTTTTDGGLLN
jgi:hypothetical protein